MNFLPPAGLEPFTVLFEESEPNPALPEGLVRFLGNLGFPAPPEHRPWVFANFVQSIDGIVSFGGNRPGGEWISRSRHDRWMMDLLRAHADALLCGAESLRQEARYGSIPGGPVYRIVDGELLRLRAEVLKRGRLKTIIVTGSGNLPTEQLRLFHSSHVEAWVATTPEGARRLADAGRLRLLITGSGRLVDWNELLRQLRSAHGVRYLLCEGGPRLYGELVRAALVDEKFLTIAPQELGSGFPDSASSLELSPGAAPAIRPTSLTGPGFTVETAPWYRWISSRRAGSHEFNRYRSLPRSSRPPASPARL